MEVCPPERKTRPGTAAETILSLRAVRRAGRDAAETADLSYGDRRRITLFQRLETKFSVVYDNMLRVVRQSLRVRGFCSTTYEVMLTPSLEDRNSSGFFVCE
jgi:hypothetical protein